MADDETEGVVMLSGARLSDAVNARLLSNVVWMDRSVQVASFG